MSSLLRDILLRHQQWEDAQDAQREPPPAQQQQQQRAARDRIPSAAADESGSAAPVQSQRSLTDTVVGAAAHLPLSRQRYRTRPPRLRAAVTSASVDGSTQPSAAAGQPVSPNRAAVPLPLSLPPPPTAATFALPFTPYDVQQEMCGTITEVLRSASPRVVPVAVAEVPTGCGKTMALLSCVLRYQQELKRMTPHELDAYLRLRRPPWQQQQQQQQQRRQTSAQARRAATATDAGDDVWCAPPSFFQHFRVHAQRKIRAELEAAGSQELRRRYDAPPCGIFYVTRTHAQLRQAVRELRRLHGAPSTVRMNILGSRDRYCIHPKVAQAKTSHTLPVEGNNLGEVCDKLVSMGMCEMADKYDELASGALEGGVGHQRGRVWDMEDLVVEGTARGMCPYYAARNLVFFADVTFCTYPYLLDPLIRHETKMEAALRNNAIVVVDEAHNVGAVCQDALSLECPSGVLALILSELAPLAANQATLAREPLQSGSTPAAQPSTEVQLGAYTLREVFAFLHCVIQSLSTFVAAAAAALMSDVAGDAVARGDKRRRGEEDGGGDATAQGAVLEQHLRRDMEAHVVAACRRGTAATPALASLELFQRAYGVIMSLGVTFNPFLFSVFGLSMLKRWLLVLRFLLHRSRSFAVVVRAAPPSAAPPVEDGETRRSLLDAFAAVAEPPPAGRDWRGTIDVRCLDGGLAFSHLLQTVHRVVLASGTLSPFPQLARDLGVAAALWRTVEGLHVVPPTQYSLTALTALPAAAATQQQPLVPLRCTYASLSNSAFLAAVARTVVRLAQTLRESSGGGVLVFLPNYAVLTALAAHTRAVLLPPPQQQLTSPRADQSPPSTAMPLFVEPRKAEALTEVLCRFQTYTQAPRRGTALFFSVYRGKVSEGLDFTDDMARLVLCLGLPLQPLLSWKVGAQRAYSGSEWYTTDAVRAVNQAMGRCLRHAKDYGAVVLLDERYAQPEYQQRLSKWCRAALQTESSLPQLCARLRTSFAAWRELSGAPAAVAPAEGEERCGGVQSTAPVSVALTRPRLGTDHLPFQLVPRSALRCGGGAAASLGTVVRAEGMGAAGGPPSSVGVLHSPLACTAVKLLYETVGATGEVSRQALQDAIQSLTQDFFGGDESDGDSCDGRGEVCE